MIKVNTLSKKKWRSTFSSAVIPGDESTTTFSDPDISKINCPFQNKTVW
jgi:hypothetical protein